MGPPEAYSTTACHVACAMQALGSQPDFWILCKPVVVLQRFPHQDKAAVFVCDWLCLGDGTRSQKTETL
ncbi:hypothetical protein FQN52_002029 [Onygenales sp. PD_12]|nr:hypothetical protein FQN52_002029 [Onygenales sp. PD_12]